MRHLIDATRSAVTQYNWYAALAVALSMPDMCGELERRVAGSQARFVDWYDRFLLSKYQGNVGASRTPHTFLLGSDCYALRCAYLHQGDFSIDDQRARQALDHFHFIAPRHGSFVHMNQHGSTLQLQVDRFCLDVCEAVEQWLASVVNDADIQARMGDMAAIM